MGLIEKIAFILNKMRLPWVAAEDKMSQRVSVRDDKSQDALRNKRLVSIDLLRGLVMVLMTLDHVRDFFSNARFNPLDLTQSNVPLFLTRWITHFCAPSFIFLAGIAAYLALWRGKSKQQLSWFLFTRGLWLVFVDLTVVRFGWKFDLTYSSSSAGVLWAIGWSMVVLAALVHLPTANNKGRHRWWWLSYL